MLHSPFHVLLKDLRTKKEKAAELLRMLPEGGPPAFDAFVGALVCTGQSNLAKLLDPEKVSHFLLLSPAYFSLKPLQLQNRSVRVPS